MELPKRKPTRLPDYDYSSPGSYFVTICTKDRRCILSDISVGADALGGPRLQLTDTREKRRDQASIAVLRYVIIITPNRDYRRMICKI